MKKTVWSVCSDIYPCMSGHPYSGSSSSHAIAISPQPPRLVLFIVNSTEITGFATVGVAQADTGNQSVLCRISYQTAMTDDCTAGTLCSVHHPSAVLGSGQCPPIIVIILLWPHSYIRSLISIFVLYCMWRFTTFPFDYVTLCTVTENTQ